MHFPMRIQPLDLEAYGESEPSKPQVMKSRLKRLFDRKPAPAYGAGAELEPSSVCLGKMVQNFIEERDEKLTVAVKCGRSRCNCFNGKSNVNGGSDDEFDGEFGDSAVASSFSDAHDLLKSLIPCESVAERNLLADTWKIVEKNKNCKRRDDLRAIVTESLSLLSYDASICKSRWDKTPSYPAGEYKYIDVIVEGGERVMIDVDFRSEFEVARPTGGYRAILQSLPYIFVGKPERLQQIIAIASEAARQSLKKKGMHIAPWRKAEYMKAKWLSPHTTRGDVSSLNNDLKVFPAPEEEILLQQGQSGEPELIFCQKTVSSTSEKELTSLSPARVWELPEIKPKRSERGARVVTGLAFLLREKP